MHETNHDKTTKINIQPEWALKYKYFCKSDMMQMYACQEDRLYKTILNTTQHSV
jgi:hypothetical protein